MKKHAFLIKLLGIGFCTVLWMGGSCKSEGGDEAVKEVFNLAKKLSEEPDAYDANVTALHTAFGKLTPEELKMLASERDGDKTFTWLTLTQKVGADTKDINAELVGALDQDKAKAYLDTASGGETALQKLMKRRPGDNAADVDALALTFVVDGDVSPDPVADAHQLPGLLKVADASQVKKVIAKTSAPKVEAMVAREYASKGAPNKTFVKRLYSELDPAGRAQIANAIVKNNLNDLPEVVKTLSEWTGKDAVAGDFYKLGGGTPGKLLPVYAASLGDLKAGHPDQRKKLADVALALQTAITPARYASYADNTVVNAIAANADSPDDARRLLALGPRLTAAQVLTAARGGTLTEVQLNTFLAGGAAKELFPTGGSNILQMLAQKPFGASSKAMLEAVINAVPQAEVADLLNTADANDRNKTVLKKLIRSPLLAGDNAGDLKASIALTVEKGGMANPDQNELPNLLNAAGTDVLMQKALAMVPTGNLLDVATKWVVDHKANNAVIGGYNMELAHLTAETTGGATDAGKQAATVRLQAMKSAMLKVGYDQAPGNGKALAAFIAASPFDQIDWNGTGFSLQGVAPGHVLTVIAGKLHAANPNSLKVAGVAANSSRATLQGIAEALKTKNPAEYGASLASVTASIAAPGGILTNPNEIFGVAGPAVTVLDVLASAKAYANGTAAADPADLVAKIKTFVPDGAAGRPQADALLAAVDPNGFRFVGLMVTNKIVDPIYEQLARVLTVATPAQAKTAVNEASGAERPIMTLMKGRAGIADTKYDQTLILMTKKGVDAGDHVASQFEAYVADINRLEAPLLANVYGNLRDKGFAVVWLGYEFEQNNFAGFNAMYPQLPANEKKALRTALLTAAFKKSKAEALTAANDTLVKRMLGLLDNPLITLINVVNDLFTVGGADANAMALAVETLKDANFTDPKVQKLVGLIRDTVQAKVIIASGPAPGVWDNFASGALAIVTPALGGNVAAAKTLLAISGAAAGPKTLGEAETALQDLTRTGDSAKARATLEGFLNNPAEAGNIVPFANKYTNNLLPIHQLLTVPMDDNVLVMFTRLLEKVQPGVVGALGVLIPDYINKSTKSGLFFGPRVTYPLDMMAERLLRPIAGDVTAAQQGIVALALQKGADMTQALGDDQPKNKAVLEAAMAVAQTNGAPPVRQALMTMSPNQVLPMLEFITQEIVKSTVQPAAKTAIRSAVKDLYTTRFGGNPNNQSRIRSQLAQGFFNAAPNGMHLAGEFLANINQWGLLAGLDKAEYQLRAMAAHGIVHKGNLLQAFALRKIEEVVTTGLTALNDIETVAKAMRPKVISVAVAGPGAPFVWEDNVINPPLVVAPGQNITEQLLALNPAAAGANPIENQKKVAELLDVVPPGHAQYLPKTLESALKKSRNDAEVVAINATLVPPNPVAGGYIGERQQWLKDIVIGNEQREGFKKLYKASAPGTKIALKNALFDAMRLEDDAQHANGALVAGIILNYEDYGFVWADLIANDFKFSDVAGAASASLLFALFEKQGATISQQFVHNMAKALIQRVYSTYLPAIKSGTYGPSALGWLGKPQAQTDWETYLNQPFGAKGSVMLLLPALNAGVFTAANVGQQANLNYEWK